MISAVRAGESSRDIEMKLRTPFGNPAYEGNETSVPSEPVEPTALTSSNSSAMIACVRGLSSEHFNTTVLPHMIGSAIALMVSPVGAFHGAIPNLPPIVSSRRVFHRP